MVMEGKSAEEVKATLTRTIDIEAIGGPLSGVVPRKNGSVALVSVNEQQRMKLEALLRTREGLTVKTTEKLNPTVTLTGLESEWTAEEIM